MPTVRHKINKKTRLLFFLVFFMIQFLNNIFKSYAKLNFVIMTFEKNNVLSLFQSLFIAHQNYIIPIHI